MTDGPVPQPGILDLTPYKAFAKPKRPGRLIRLMANEGALGPSPRAVEAYKAAAGEIHRYPESGSGSLVSALAKHHGLDPERLVIGNGSDELIELLCHCFAGHGDEVVYTQYGFVMYPTSARAAGATPVAAPDDGYTASVDAILAKVTARTKIVFLANPNNPTGTYLARSEVERLWKALPRHVVLVLDAAYAEYVERNDYSSGVELAGTAPNVIMLRTFSKLFGLAGLRLGWGYGAPAVVDVLNRVHGVFNVNAAAQAAGIAALEDVPFQDRSKTHNRIWMPRVQERLKALGLEPQPTVANFLLVRVPAGLGKTPEQILAFCAERGIFLREMRTYGMADCFRLSIGTEEENGILLDTLAECLGHG
jgi:histidinol-phosphate aminotransferase